jgi:RNA polymerase sigma factor for flagellar operon FliA
MIAITEIPPKRKNVNSKTACGASRHLAVRNRMVEEYLPLVRNIAASLSAQTSPNVDYDDLVSIGVFGLIDAVNNYDPSRNVKFSSYCKLRIKGAMIDELRQLDWVPRLTRQRNKMLRRAEQNLKSRLHREPRSEELAAELNMDMKQFERLSRDADPINVVSLESIIDGEDGPHSAIGVLQDERSQDPADRTEKIDTRKFLTRELSNVQRWVVTLYYYEQLSMRQIGNILGLSEGRVSQIHSQVIEQLRRILKRSERQFDQTFEPATASREAIRA